jgi:hypothetical protein
MSGPMLTAFRAFTQVPAEIIGYASCKIPNSGAATPRKAAVFGCGAFDAQHAKLADQIAKDDRAVAGMGAPVTC